MTADAQSVFGDWVSRRPSAPLWRPPLRAQSSRRSRFLQESSFFHATNRRGPVRVHRPANGERDHRGPSVHGARLVAGVRNQPPGEVVHRRAALLQPSPLERPCDLSQHAMHGDVGRKPTLRLRVHVDDGEGEGRQGEEEGSGGGKGRAV